MARSPDPRRLVPERQVLMACLAVLHARGVAAWRQNTGAVKQTYKGRTRFTRYGVPGQADITGILPDARRLEVEVKRFGKRPTAKQCEWLRKINGSGGVALWVDDAGHLDRVLPRLIAGAWIELDEAGDCWLVTGD
jgi:hypothetical protein